MAKKLSFFSIFLFSLLLFSCGTTPVEEKIPPVEFIPEVEEESEIIESEVTVERGDELTVVFAGDVMAHTPNFQMKDYSKIWKAVKDVTLNSDLALANIEAPVADELPMSSYPSFNMHSSYVEACIDAGFNTFSLSNNHTNDHYAKGIQGTFNTIEKLTAKYKEKGIELNFSGIRQKNAELSYCYFEKNGWKILFCAMTELLNRPNDKEWINFISPTEKERTAYINYLKKLREDNPCDLFIVSVHTAEPEYTRKVTEAQEAYYDSMLEAGVDVVWANHAHIIKDRKVIGSGEDGRLRKIVMFANGNTISGQRTSPNFNLKMTERDDTGDGLYYKVVFKKDDNGKPYIQNTKNIYITTYINTAGEYVIKKLDDSFIKLLLEPPARNDWAKYIEKRKSITEGTKELLEWQ